MAIATAYQFLCESDEEDELDERARFVSVQGFAEEIVRLFRDVDFKSHFRLSRNTTELLLQNIGIYIYSAISHILSVCAA